MFKKLFGQEQVETVKLHINPAQLANPKNINGSEGPICNNCGGYGFTMKLKGGTLPCHLCFATGVKSETREELEVKIAKMEKEFEKLKEVNLATLREIGVIRGVTNE